MLTKNDLQQIENLIKFHQEDLQEDIVSKMVKFKSEILDAVDAVMGEIIKSREEQIVASSQLSAHTDKIENHEERIGNLETKVGLSV